MSWGAWAAIFYPLLFAACNILLLPGGVLAVGGGFFFGLWWGFLIVFAGNIVSTAISFALSRFVARRWFRRKLSANPMLRALGPAVERESWKIILLSQLHPLFPTSLLNYFYGLTRIRFRTYMLWASSGACLAFSFTHTSERWVNLQCVSCAAKVIRRRSSIGFGAARSSRPCCY